MNNGRMIILLAALALLLGTAATVPAAQQEAGSTTMVHKGEKFTSQEYVEKRLAVMTRQLDLSPEQQVSIKAILTEELATRMQISKDLVLSDEAKKLKLKELRETTFVKISAFLTPEQQAKQDTRRAQAVERRKMKKGN